MRLLVSGDLAATGFGSVTIDLGKELLKLDLDVRFLSQNDLPRLEEPFSSRTIDLRTFSIGRDISGELGVTGLSKGIAGLFDGTAPVLMHDGAPYGDWRPDVFLLISDFSSAREHIVTPLAQALTIPTYLYLPIEGIGLPPRWAETFRIARPVAMSRFGAAQIERLMGEPPPMAYHGVDTDAFRPVSERGVLLMGAGNRMNVLKTREDCKRAWAGLLAEKNGIPIGQVPLNWLLRTDRHMPRKRYNSLIRSLLPALSRNPSWALVIHCNPQDQGGNLWDQVSKLPPQMRRQVLLTDSAGIPRDLLCSLYNASDLYVSNSAEGFGLTIAEALACGLPAVGVRYSAVPEVIGPAGVTVEEGGLIDDHYDAYWWAASEPDFGAAVEDLMTHDTRRLQLGRLGPPHIRESFRWDACAAIFRDLLVPVGVA